MIQKLSELVFKVEKTYYHGLAPSPSKVLEEFPQEFLTLSKLKKDFLRELKSLSPVFKIRFLNRSENSLTLFFSSKKIKRSFSFKIYRPENLSFDMFLNLIRPFSDLDKGLGLQKQAELKFDVLCRVVHRIFEIDDAFSANRKDTFRYIVETVELVKHKLREKNQAVLDNYSVEVFTSTWGHLSFQEIQIHIFRKKYDPVLLTINIYRPKDLPPKIMETLFSEKEIKSYLKKDFNKKYRKTAELKFDVERIVSYDNNVFPFSILNDTSLSLTRRGIQELIKKDRGEFWKIFGKNPTRSFYYSLSNVDTEYDYRPKLSPFIKFSIEFTYRSILHGKKEFPITLHYFIEAPQGVPMDKLLPEKLLSQKK